MGRGRSNTPGKRRPPVGGASSPPIGSNGRPVEPIDFVIPSDLDEVGPVQKAILDRVRHCGFDAESAFAIKLSLEEALINAIKHGNRFDLSKTVHVQARVTPTQAEITIEDQGPGFKRHHVPDPTLEENLEKCSGRGILLMESYMTSVEWSQGGRRVRMVRRNAAKAAAKPA
jgi:serine/threonine-protein kinase RsbW